MKKEETSTRSRITVSLPSGAELFVQGRKMKVESTSHTFVTPKLKRGARFSYQMKAVLNVDGEEVVETKKVYLTAGKSTRVNFNELAKRAPSNRARIVVKMPSNAKLFVDGQEMKGTGASRAFNTPQLVDGQRYVYNLKAELRRDGETISDSKVLRIWAGKKFEVNFEKLGKVETVRR